MEQYVKTVWVDGQAPARNATNLNKQEQGIFDNSTHANSTHAPSDAEKNSINTVIDADYVHTDNNYTDSDKAIVDASVTLVVGEIIKTVASESSANPETFDFLNLYDAIGWANSIKNNSITLMLDDGAHYSDNGTNNLTIINNSVTLHSISEDKTLCTITPTADYASAGILNMIYCIDSQVKLIKITFDSSYGGNTSTLIVPITVDIFSTLMLTQSTIVNGYFIKVYGRFYLDSSVIDNVKYGLSLYESANLMCSWGSIIKNCSTSAIMFGQDGNKYVNINGGGTSTVFENNGEDYPVTLNEIQPDGALITDNSHPLAQAYDADTAKTDVAQTFTEPQRTTVEVGANALALTDKQTLSFTATAADITIASQTSGQAGTFRVLSSENITGWGAEFFWGTQGEPAGLTGTQVFSYEVFDASGADSIAIGIL